MKYQDIFSSSKCYKVYTPYIILSFYNKKAIHPVKNINRLFINSLMNLTKARSLFNCTFKINAKG